MKSTGAPQAQAPHRAPASHGALQTLGSELEKALAATGPYLLEVRTRGDVPMPRTGYWDIADFLKLGND